MSNQYDPQLEQAKMFASFAHNLDKALGLTPFFKDPYADHDCHASPEDGCACGSYLQKLQEEARQIAVGYFMEQGYLASECDYYANQFIIYALESKTTGVSVQDLFKSFLEDIVWSNHAEKEKEASRYA